jgi:hypothetical protein
MDRLSKILALGDRDIKSLLSNTKIGAAPRVVKQLGVIQYTIKIATDILVLFNEQCVNKL